MKGPNTILPVVLEHARRDGRQKDSSAASSVSSSRREIFAVEACAVPSEYLNTGRRTIELQVTGFAQAAE